MGKKQPKKAFSPKDGKVPSFDPSIKSPYDQKPAWQLKILDLEGPYGWKKVKRLELINDILPKLKSFETMLWKEILPINQDAGNHVIKKTELPPEAQRRLRKLELDDFEQLISLRVKQKVRIWGVMIDRVFQVLWWDPEHLVNPSKR